MEAFAEHLEHPVGRGRAIAGAHTGTAGGALCGDLIRVDVRVEGDRVAEAGFEASGCGAAIAAGSAAVALAEGAPLLDAARDAFVNGLQVTAGLSAVGVAALAVLVLVLLRNVRTGGGPHGAPAAEEPAYPEAPAPAQPALTLAGRADD